MICETAKRHQCSKLTIFALALLVGPLIPVAVIGPVVVVILAVILALPLVVAVTLALLVVTIPPLSLVVALSVLATLMRGGRGGVLDGGSVVLAVLPITYTLK